jgi:hypothetical protein
MNIKGALMEKKQQEVGGERIEGGENMIKVQCT